MSNYKMQESNQVSHGAFYLHYDIVQSSNKYNLHQTLPDITLLQLLIVHFFPYTFSFINDNLEAQSQALLTGTITANETISTSLGDIVDFIDGDRGKYYPAFDEFSDMGYCLFLNASNVTSTGFSFDTCQFVTKEKDELLRKGHLSRGDIVLTSRGTLGNVAFYNNYIPFDNVRINSGMLIIRPKTDRYSPVFLYTLLKSGYMKAAIESLKSGSAQPQLPIKDLQKAQFEIPTDDGGLLQLSDKLSCLDNAYSENRLEIMALKNMSSLILSELSSR